MSRKVRNLVKDYVESHNLTILNLLDPISEFAFQFGVRGIPVSLFISPQDLILPQNPAVISVQNVDLQENFAIYCKKWTERFKVYNH